MLKWLQGLNDLKTTYNSANSAVYIRNEGLGGETHNIKMSIHLNDVILKGQSSDQMDVWLTNKIEKKKKKQSSEQLL